MKNFQFSIFNFQRGLLRSKQSLVSGFTLVEILIAVAVFLLFSMGAYQAFTSLYTAITATRLRALAADLANAQFEMIKNLPYTSVGTLGGSPSGVLAPVETLVRDDVSFTVTITVVNVDDPFDGILGGGDVFPADYKLVEINIDCLSCKNLSPVVITGRVAPKNLEI